MTEEAPAGGPPPVAVVLTPVASAQALAGLCAMAGLDCHVVPSSSGAVAVVELTGEPDRAAAGDASADDAAGDYAPDSAGRAARSAHEDLAGPGDDEDLPVGDWDISELFGAAEDTLPPRADRLAKDLSRLSKTGVVLVTAALSEDGGFEHGLSGQLTARRYGDGEAGDEVAVGLVLAGADDVVEDLLLRRVRVADVPGEHRSSDIPRWKAARMFSKGLRRRKP